MVFGVLRNFRPIPYNGDIRIHTGVWKTGSLSVRMVYHWILRQIPFLRYSQVQDRSGVDAKFTCKNVSKQMQHTHCATGDARRPCFSISLDFTVNMLGLCDFSNLLLVLSTEQRRAFLKLLWGLVNNPFGKLSQDLLGRFSRDFHQMVGIWSYITDPIFLWSLKGYCNGNQL